MSFPRVLFAEDLQLQKAQLYADLIVPSLSQRIGEIVGDIERARGAIEGAIGLLREGDGFAIATSMAGVIDGFTGWLRGQIEADSAVERANIAVAQANFLGPIKPRWMWRQAVGGPPASQARTRLGLGWPSGRVLGQWAPGAVYIFPRLSWDCVRRSFRRTDVANPFDVGQPDLTWTPADVELATCIPRASDYWQGRGCGYNPGERIQLSPGTWPYVSGADVLQWSGLTSVDCVGHYLALHTPSAVHVLTDARPVRQIWDRWRALVLDRLPQLPAQGQVDDGVYRTATQQVYVQGNAKQTFQVEIAGVQWSIRADAAQSVSDSFVSFFELRKAVLRDWPYLAASVRSAGKESMDPLVRARALGLPSPDAAPSKGGEGQYNGLDMKGTGSRSGGGLLLIGVTAAFLGYKALRRSW